ncbi:hypothetical protein PoB_003873400 [Plakobranchus ocellatus]|uniref:Uncharacterized protein n=1 Tax=Plakobranchus ocellatus TaxID=259542 RepID=A0AAV4AWQ6_9GAST|nr:hypothetical protein PoB_003873400 [Plakobranchus ocellatus]
MERPGGVQLAALFAVTFPRDVQPGSLTGEKLHKSLHSSCVRPRLLASLHLVRPVYLGGQAKMKHLIPRAFSELIFKSEENRTISQQAELVE